MSLRLDSIFLTLCSCRRDEQTTNQRAATRDAKLLISAENDDVGMQRIYKDILTKRSFKQIALVSYLVDLNLQH